MGKKKQIKAKCYESIDDMPVYNWFKAHEDGEVKWFFLPGVKDFSKRAREQAYAAWGKLKDQFIDKFGISDTQKIILMLKRDLALLKIKKHLSGDDSIENFIRAKEQSIEAIRKNQGPGDDFVITKGYVEKFMGMRIDAKLTTVSEFYGYIEMMKRQPKPAPPKGGRTNG